MSRPDPHGYDVGVRVLRGGAWLVLEWEDEYGERKTAGIGGPIDMGTLHENVLRFLPLGSQARITIERREGRR